MVNISKLIKRFISEVISKYPNLHVEYNYDDELDQHEIWHNSNELEFENEEFSNYIGEKADEFLFKNNIYNFYFAYDHLKAKQLNEKSKSYNRVDAENVPYEFTQRSAQYKNINYQENLNTNTIGSVNIEFKKVDVSIDKENEYTINSSTTTMQSIIYHSNPMGVAA